MAASSSRKLNCKVILLDDSIQTHLVQRKVVGAGLISLVFGDLKLIETDYFGLEYINKSNVPEWLDKEKPIFSQTGVGNSRDLTFKLKVKFYTSEPTLLEHDLTRYYFALQVKQDLASGQLSCNENTASILASYIVQSELGDFYYQANEHDYLKSIRLLPNQNDEIEDKIAEYHKRLRGLSAEEAEFQLLDIARKTEMYGIVPHTCTSPEGFTVQLSVNHSGIHTLVSGVKTSSYIWVKIRKLGFKRKRFLIKLFPNKEKPKENSVVEFVFHTRDAAKAFWKLSVEHHSFFRKLEIKPLRRSRHGLLSRGSSFRYCGRTQTQLVEQMKQKWGQSTFDRSMSLRNFPSTSAQHFGKSLTFNNRQDLGIMTLDRARSANSKLTVPSASQATLESRYSGCYETTPQPANSINPLLPVSHSLSAIASLSKSNGKFDLKTSSTFLQKQDGDRNSNRDSIAVVEDNRVELERLVEKINSDLTSAQRDKCDDSEGNELINRASSIEHFLSSTAQPVKITQPAITEPPQPLQQQESPQKQPQQPITSHIQQTPGAISDTSHMAEDSNTETKEASDFEENHDLCPPGATVTYTISDDETLEILLTEDVKDTPVTDLDVDIKQHTSHTSIEIELNTHNITVHDVLDNETPPADCTLVLSVDKPSAEKKQTAKLQKQEAVDSVDSVDADVIVLSSPDPDDEDLVFRSGLELSVPASVRRSRTRSKQEEMEDLQDISKIAEDVLKYGETHEMVSQKSQDLSDLATQVLDFCTESDVEQEPQLSDLSELLAHYDTIKQQQQRFNLTSANSNQGLVTREPLIDSNKQSQSNGRRENVKSASFSSQPPSERTKRKPLSRPALPALVPKERLKEPLKSDSFENGSNSKHSLRIEEHNTDSGIDIIPPSAIKHMDSTVEQSGQSSSDGYSSEGEECSSSSQAIC